MLDEEIKRRIYRKLENMDETLSYDITSLCEYRAVISEVLMLYYWENREVLKEASNE